MIKSNPAALMSYVHSDDKYKQLSTLRERLSDEVQMQIGIEFPIFQDTKDIHWGQNWEERIKSALTEEVTFLIPIITPSFFNSQPCRYELARFLEVEEKLKRNDLILPIYFVDTPLLNDAELRRTDPLTEVIGSRQYADWRELRFEPFTNPLVGKTLAQLAVQIREALPRVHSTRRLNLSNTSKPQPATVNKSEATEHRTEGPASKTEPPTISVDPLHRGDFAKINEAIKHVVPGTRILVRPGLYQESLVIDKPLEIIGDGGPGEIVVMASKKDVIVFQTTMGRVVNLTLRQTGGSDWYCVDIAQGRLELEDCDISSQSLSCVGIHGGADPRLRRNRIHDSQSGFGVLLYENAQGTLEDNDIFGNAIAGVSIEDWANPSLRRNRIYNNKEGGLTASENAQGNIDDNDIFSNLFSGALIEDDANPILRRNRIRDNQECGVYVYDGGQGLIEDNDILGNGYSGIISREGGNPAVKNNRINDNLRFGIEVYENGGGTFEDNDLTENSYGAKRITAPSKQNVRLANNKE